MKERGLLLTKDLRAKSRSGEKKQTRRLVKPQPRYEKGYWSYEYEKGCHHYIGDTFPTEHWSLENMLPYAPYQLGDHLYLQEPYQVKDDYYHFGNNDYTDAIEIIGEYLDDNGGFHITLSGKESGRFENRRSPHVVTSARYMYRSLARTWFEVTDVRVERLQDIKGEGVLAEGINPPVPAGCEIVDRPADFDDWNEIRQEDWFQTQARATYMSRCADVDNCFNLFQDLWDSTNKIKWADNPWIFKTTYKRIDK